MKYHKVVGMNSRNLSSGGWMSAGLVSFEGHVSLFPSSGVLCLVEAPP